MVARGRDSYGVWDGCIYTAIFKMDNQQESSVWNSAHCYMAAWMGEGSLRENGYMHLYG